MRNVKEFDFELSKKFKDLAGYSVPKRRAKPAVRLDGNEGPPPDEVVIMTLRNINPECVRRYPDASSLEEKIAQMWGVDRAKAIATAGADDAIARLCEVIFDDGRDFVVPSPTFEIFAHFAKLAGAKIVEVPWESEEYPLNDVLSRINEKTAAVCVVSPNNPTGATATKEQLIRLAEAAPKAVIIVDAAYAEFCDEDLTETALSLPNCVVLRTLSKALGLAGLRVGYAMGPAKIIGAMRLASGPYAISGPSLEIALAKLNQSAEASASFLDRVKLERNLLYNLLAELGAKPLRSRGNFVMARMKDPKWFWDALAGLGFAIRVFPNSPALLDAARITCPGDEKIFDGLQHAIKSALSPQAIIFDMDGVIADASRSYRLAMIETAKTYGVNFTFEDIIASKYEGDANNDWILTKRMMAARGVEAQLEEITERFEAFYHGTEESSGLWRNETMLVDKELLRSFHSRYKTAIVTGRPRLDANRFLRNFGIEDCFDALVCMKETAPKPSPEPVLKAMKDLGVERAWMIGDTPDDIVAARLAEVVPIGVAPPSEMADDTALASLYEAGAARILKSLNELTEVLP